MCDCVYVCCSRNRSTKNNSIFVGIFKPTKHLVIYFRIKIGICFLMTTHISPLCVYVRVCVVVLSFDSECLMRIVENVVYLHALFLLSFFSFIFTVVFCHCRLLLVSLVVESWSFLLLLLSLLLLYAFDVYVNNKKSLLGVNFKAICCVIYLFVLFTFRFWYASLVECHNHFFGIVNFFQYCCCHHLRFRCHCHHTYFPNILSPICCR